MFDGAPESGRILLVDDDALLRGALERVLGRRGWTVVAAADGLDARARLKEGVFDVVISDVNMPGYGGLQFLRAVRERDPHMPVILMTGKPSVESSIGAIEHGVFRYLVKPVRSDILEDVVSRAARLHRLARLNAQALEALDVDAGWPLDRTALEAAFARAIDRLWMAFQPIVSWRSRTTYGYEALMRSDEPELPTPLLVLGAAERLGRLDELGRLVRRRVAERAAELPAGQKLFVNLHARDLGDDDLIDPNAPLSRIAGRVVLEVTERASLDGVPRLMERLAALRALGFDLAVDDLGAGYAGLSSFTQLDPRVAKLDMGLIRDIDRLPKKQSVVRAMRELCDELGVMVIAEGVETVAERDTLAALGCDHMQGYLFARPARGFPTPVYPDDVVASVGPVGAGVRART